jgi:hypothetical protein
VVGAAGAAVVGVQVLDELGAGLAERDGPVLRDAVGVAGVGEDVAERDALPREPGQDGTSSGTGSWSQEVRVARRASSGTGGCRPPTCEVCLVQTRNRARILTARYPSRPGRPAQSCFT